MNSSTSYKLHNPSKYISIFKDSEEVAAGENKCLTVELDIPESDDYCPSYGSLPDEILNEVNRENYPMMGSFSSSFFGQIVKVWYVLRVFVKHDAWNEWGEGHSIDFPIKILPNNTQIVSNDSIVAVEPDHEEYDEVELEIPGDDGEDDELNGDRVFYQDRNQMPTNQVDEIMR